MYNNFHNYFLIRNSSQLVIRSTTPLHVIYIKHIYVSTFFWLCSIDSHNN